MSARFQFYQTYGASPGIDVPQGIGANSNDWDFKRTDEPGPITTPTTQGIYAGNFSMQAYLRGRFDQPTDGSPQFSSVDNVKFYASTVNLSGCGNGAYILASGTGTFAQPATTSKSGVWAPIPTLAVSGLTIGSAGLTVGTAGWTNWVGLQLKTNVSGASAGYSAYSNFTIVWDEI